MKLLKLSLVAVVLVLAVTLTIGAEDKEKKVKLEGSLVCGKYTLGITDACSNVLVVEKDGKKVNYFLDDKGRKAKYHKGVCPPNSKKKATVTGVVVKKDGKMYIKNPKVKLAK